MLAVWALSVSMLPHESLIRQLVHHVDGAPDHLLAILGQATGFAGVLRGQRGVLGDFLGGGA
jgi:hypothetical protein